MALADGTGMEELSAPSRGKRIFKVGVVSDFAAIVDGPEPRFEPDDMNAEFLGVEICPVSAVDSAARHDNTFARL